MIWSNVTVKLSDLQPWEHNPRTMTKNQAQRLLKSWQDLGQFQTIAIGPSENGSGHPVYDGHQRLSALLAAYGKQYAIDARQSDRQLTEDERRYLITQANLPVGAWRFEEIAGWPEAQEWGFDAEMLATWNSDAAALATMLEAEQPTGDADAEPQIDRAAELNEKWQVKTGDLWRIGEHRLLCGDSTRREDVDRVMQGEHATLAPVDPPYNVGFDYDGETVDDDKSAERYEAFSRAWFKECQDVSDNQIVTPGCNNLASWLRWFDPYHVAPWIKEAAMTNGKVSRWWCWEPILFFGETWKRTRANDVFHYEAIPQKLATGETLTGIHPCPKPLPMWSDLVVNYSEPQSIVAEFFAGTGTTLVACQNLQRKCRAIEISPNYCAVILERMATAFPGIEIERISEAILTHGT